MAEGSVFDRLVGELSSVERQALLTRLHSMEFPVDEPISPDDTPVESTDVEKYFKKLGLFHKLLLFLKRIFLGKSLEELIEEELLRDLAARIQAAAPGLIDFRGGRFLPPLCSRVEELKKAAHGLAEPVLRAAGQNRPDFLAFLAGLELEEMHSRLLTETAPAFHAGDPPASSEELSDAELKRRMEASLDDVTQVIDERERGLMYADAKFLANLALLTTFPFDSILKCFRPVEEAPALPVDFRRVKEHLLRLADILFSMRLPPSATMLQALYLYDAEESFPDDPAERQAWLDEQLPLAREALAEIRRFAKTVPMYLIARLLTGNEAYHCRDLGGGEDWLVQLRQYWKGRIDRQSKDFSLTRKRDEILLEVSQTLMQTPLQFPLGYDFHQYEGGRSGIYRMSIGLMKSFFGLIFVQELNRHLKALIIDGEFYKPDNRTEFTDAYSGCLKMSEKLAQFEASLAPDGSLSRELESLNRDGSSKPVKTRKMLQLVRGADRQAEALIANARELLQSLCRVLDGVLFGEPGGRYDTVSNLAYIGGRGNAELKKGLEAALRRCEKVAGLLEKLSLLESSFKDY